MSGRLPSENSDNELNTIHKTIAKLACKKETFEDRQQDETGKKRELSR